jgi:hypothetical protein
MMFYVHHEGISNLLATVTAFLSFRLRMRMNHKIDCVVRKQGETKLIARFVINGKGNKIDREVRNQWETKLIARFVINGKQN